MRRASSAARSRRSPATCTVARAAPSAARRLNGRHRARARQLPLARRRRRHVRPRRPPRPLSQAAAAVALARAPSRRARGRSALDHTRRRRAARGAWQSAVRAPRDPRPTRRRPRRSIRRTQCPPRRVLRRRTLRPLTARPTRRPEWRLLRVRLRGALTTCRCGVPPGALCRPWRTSRRRWRRASVQRRSPPHASLARRWQSARRGMPSRRHYCRHASWSLSAPTRMSDEA